MTAKSPFDEDEWFVLYLYEGFWETTVQSTVAPFNSRTAAEAEADNYAKLGYKTRVVHSVFTY